ncbi:MAG TPA: M20/M25/M40 family metallo-hydrolase [Pyrinomonadaceae bacterium]|jgi:acetylornithine deacetylase
MTTEMDVIAFTQQLIDIPSLTGDEGALALFLRDYLESLNYKVELQEVAGGRSNIVALTNDAPRVVLSTHMDTVPPHIPANEDAEYIYGRGACDAKGIIAAQIAAAARLRAEGIEQLGLLFTVDEEMSSLGARSANEHPAAKQCRYLINGEPTDNLLAVGSKGSLRVRIITSGRAAHSAYPEHGESAIEKMLAVLADILAAPWPQDEFFGATTCNIGTIAGGTRPNVIPAEAEATLQIRLVKDSALIKNIFERAIKGRVEIEYLSAAEPVRMLAVEGFEQCIVRFTTDIPYLKNWGTPLLIGAGSILDAHTEHERVSKSELLRSVELYAQLVRALLAQERHS